LDFVNFTLKAKKFNKIKKLLLINWVFPDFICKAFAQIMLTTFMGKPIRQGQRIWITSLSHAFFFRTVEQNKLEGFPLHFKACPMD
jgi:hypothetical protein